MADRAMLKSGFATSIANTLMLFETPLLTKVSFQQVPQPAELNPVTAGAPPMWGNLGREPKVVNPLVIKPFVPVEHATVVRDWAELS